jgi:hypothetical protein
MGQMIGSPTFQRGKVVLGLPKPGYRRPDLDDQFIRSVQNDFPVVASRQLLASEAPLQVPYLLLQSTASRLAVSAVGAEMEVAFYGEFANNYQLCREYLKRKSMAVIRGWAATTEVVPSLFGVLLTANFSFTTLGTSPVKHLLEHHLRPGIVNPSDVQDALAKIAVRVDDRYFVNAALSNFEIRQVERPLYPGQLVQVKAWEGDVVDFGISAEIDVNNRLTAFKQKTDPSVTAQEVDALLGLLDQVIESLPSFVETGQFALTKQTKKVGGAREAS